LPCLRARHFFYLGSAEHHPRSERANGGDKVISRISNSSIRRLLVANRSEIAIRIFRAATELGLRMFAVYVKEDRLSLHRFKADEAYQIGKGRGALEAYLAIDEIIDIAKRHHVDAIHPGYGFLSESPEFAEARAREGILCRSLAADDADARKQGSSAQSGDLARRSSDAGERAAISLGPNFSMASSSSLASAAACSSLLLTSLGGGAFPDAATRA
jgi:pyruvate carboxylase